MKRRIIGGLLVGLPLTVFSLLLYLTGAWAELAIVLAQLFQDRLAQGDAVKS